MLRLKVERNGVTRIVILAGPWAFKIARGWRGWLANQSEWRRRRAPQVNPPIATAVHFVAVYPRAELELAALPTWVYSDKLGLNRDEQKWTSWGRVNGRLVLLDFDRAWEEPSWPLGRLYYWNQERLARKWSKLPSAESYDERSTL